jgi:cell division protein FtsB
MVTLAVIILINFLLIVVFGEKSLVDLVSLKRDRKSAIEHNEALVKKNISLYHKIERLKYDPMYIENVARKQLGLVGKNDIILKPARRTEKQTKK